MDSLAEEVFLTLQGELCEPVPGVEDAFEEGKPCSRWYGEMLDAYERLCHRLGTQGEDPDGEIMTDSLLRIQRELCLMMFEYGKQFASR